MAGYNPLYTQQLMDKYGVAWFKFDEASGNVTDSKGTAIGTVNGTTRVSGWNGNGSALNFNGTNSYVSFTSPVLPTSKKSIRFKIKCLPNTLISYFIANVRNFNSSYKGETFAIDTNGMLGYGYWNGTALVNSITTSISIADNQWHDILFTWDGTTNTSSLKLYVDNMLIPNVIGTATVNALTTTSNLYLGTQQDGISTSGRNLNGILDELEIYNEVINPIANKFLILNNNEYKKWNTSTYQLELVTSTLPTESDFINNGNEKSDIALIPETVWKSLLGDSFDVLYYTDNMGKTSANLEITHNYSPLDDLEGDFDLVTYIENDDIQEVNTEINCLPIEQITIDTRDIQLYGDLSKVIVNSIDNIQVNGNIKLVLSFDKGVTWNSFINNSWITIDINSKIDFNTNGMTTEQLQNINEIDLLSKINNEDKTIRLAYYVDEYISASTPLQISDIKTVQKASLSSPIINNASLYILNTISTINLSLKGNTIDGIIDDIDHGKVKYRVYLNNNPYYPANGDFTSFETTPLNIAIRIDNKDVLMDQQNTLKVEIQDYWGENDYWETTFIGTYSGLIFKDSSGEYYSNDIGEVLKYMDIGTLIAGQVSEEYEVHLYNTYGYDVKDVIITPKTDSSAVQIELSKQIEPFISESSLQWDLLNNGEGVVFYVRLATQYTTPPVKDGIFELRVNANPVDTSL